MFMNEVRRDKIHSGRYIVISPKRAKRPTTAVWEKRQCFFCPGNEKMTPPEICRVKEKNEWIIRVFPNKFPAFSTKYPDAYGVHWVVVETPNHEERFYQLNKKHIIQVIETYIEMMKRASKIKGISSMLLFKNEGKEAGMSSTHLHSQFIATKKMFPNLESELKTCREYHDKNKRCIYCDLIKKERKSERFVYENNHFIASTPYASLYPYSVIIFPKKHMSDFTKMDNDQISDFAEMLKKMLTAIHMLGHGYNFYIHTSKKKYHHFHLEIRPRPNIYAGFELGAGIVINTMPPEEAAKYLRKAVHK
jgi:UDPglucose--hexose-1-phosphate uridylyltransferase